MRITKVLVNTITGDITVDVSFNYRSDDYVQFITELNKLVDDMNKNKIDNQT